MLDVGKAPLIVAVGGIEALQTVLTLIVNEGIAVLVASTRERAAELLLQGSSLNGEGGAVIGELRIKPLEGLATWAGTRLVLSQAEVRMLAILGERPGRAITFEELVEAAWAGPYFGDSSAVRAAVKRLRKRLSGGTDGFMIESVRGVGFRLVVTA